MSLNKIDPILSGHVADLESKGVLKGRVQQKNLAQARVRYGSSAAPIKPM